VYPICSKECFSHFEMGSVSVTAIRMTLVTLKAYIVHQVGLFKSPGSVLNRLMACSFVWLFHLRVFESKVVQKLRYQIEHVSLQFTILHFYFVSVKSGRSVQYAYC